MSEPADDGLLHDRVHIDRSRLVRSTPLTLRTKPAEHLAPDTIDDDYSDCWGDDCDCPRCLINDGPKPPPPLQVPLAHVARGAWQLDPDHRG